MKKTIVLLLVIIPFYFSIAQIIKGKVLNEIDQPIPNTTIYLDGTTIGTTSKEDGSFMLDLSSKKNANLVFQKENYETLSTSITDVLNKTLKVVLMKAKTIEEVQIVPYTEESYKNFINYFLDTFIGYDKENVRIRNQRTLKFSYDKKNKILNVKAPKTLIIENKNLGYEIEYNLIGFSADFNANMFNYMGTSFFKKTKNTDRIKLNRMNAYEGSMLHFFRCVFQKTVSEDGFIVNKVIEVPNPKYPTEDELSKLTNFREMVKNSRNIKIPEDISEIISRKNSEKPYALAITKLKIPISDYSTRNENNVFFSFPDMLQVNYIKYFYELKNKQFVKNTIPVALSSYLRSEGETFEVSKEGNITPPEQLINQGDFSKNRIENMLPLDYQLGD
ncbi:carboxypeptidase-like regulatory domain-containing protein [Chryseobacterium paridis]|uniref:Carboxypeptidase-like regulatory domain-containing protein n=1 Tax=Chryseobacterium paridis TaxID=2800328 RepID=A0ABS1FSQ8_9FLAO|nr:carboxypeptidase-like regulatory domain-containing protein [Chryseobacterium paridis]MBK1895463.1 carboxypeptidase-like regulatory domain-containing protein [Chryseobacterium paridis]